MRTCKDIFEGFVPDPEKRKHRRHILKMLRTAAIEANKINPDKPIAFYYDLFIKKLDKKDYIEPLKEEFFGKDVIDT